MKDGKKRTLGIVLCVSLVFGTITLPAFADSSVGIPTGQNTWDDDTSSYDGDGNSGGDGAGIDTDAGLPADTDPAPGGDPGANPAAPDTDGTGDETPDSTDPDPSAPQGDDGVVVLGAPEIGAQSEGDPPATELEAARRMTISSTLRSENVNSGAATTLAFTMSYNSAGGTVQIAPAKLRAIITTPKEIALGVVDSSMFHLEGTVEDGLGGNVTTLIFDQVPEGGAGSSFDAIILTTKNGVLADGTTYDINVKWMYDQDSLFDGDQVCTITNNAPYFGWNSLYSSTTSSYTAVGNNVPAITVIYRLNNAMLSQIVGRAFTKSVEISDTINVSDKIIVTAAMLDALVWQYNNVDLPGGSYEILSYHDEGAGHIKQFRVKNTVTNDTLSGAAPADMNNISNISLTFKGIQVNSDKAKPAAPSQVDINQALQSTAMVANIYPHVSASSSNLNQTDDQGVRYQQLGAYSLFSTKVVYYWSDYVPEDPTDPAQTGRIQKNVKSITTTDGKVVDGEDRILYAWPGELVTYQLEGFGNYLDEKKLKNFKVTDEFNLDEMYPVALSPGSYVNGSGTFVVRIYIKNGNDESEAYRASYSTTGNHSGTTVDLRTLNGNVSGNSYNGKALDLTKISKIEFDYSAFEIPPSFRASPGKGPTITTFIRNRNIPNPNPESEVPQSTLTNTAFVSYDCDGVTYDYDSLTQEQKDIEYNFRDENEIIYYQKVVEKTGSKTFMKLRGNNPTSTTLEVGDLLEYTITFTNKTGQYAKDPFIDDTYGEGLTPYIKDEEPYNLTASAYYKEPFISLVSVVNEAGRDVTAARALAYNGVYVGPVNYGDSTQPGAYVYDPANGVEPYIKANMMRIRFKSTLGPGGLPTGTVPDEHYIHPGDSITVTYLMKVTDPAKVSNEFNAYGYPVYTGGETLIHFDGGKNDGSKVEPNPYKPTVSLTQTVTRANGGNAVSSSYPVEDGELLNVKLTLQNSDIKNAPNLTLHGFTSVLNSQYNDVLKYVQAATVEAKIYKTPTDPSPVVRQVTMETPGTGFYYNNSTYKNKTALVFRDGGGNVESITLNPSAKVELTFQLKAEGWAGDTTPYPYEILYSYAILKEPYTSYNASSRGNSSNWISGLSGTSYVSTSTTVYLAKRQVPIAQAWVYGNTSYLPLNNLAEGARPERTGTVSYGVQVRNVGRVDLPITKIYVRLPTNERFKRITPYKTSNFYYAETLYDAEVLPTLYGDRQIVVLTPKSELVLKPNFYAGADLNSNQYIGIETYVENDTANQMIADHLGQPNFTDSMLEVAFYSKGVEVLSDPSTNKIAAVTDAEKELWGGAAMGADTAKGALNRALSNRIGYYSAYYPLPGVTVAPLRKFTYGQTHEYKDPGSLPFGPKENMAWRVVAGLQNNTSYLRTLSDAVVVLKLPSGFTFTGIEEPGYTGQTFTGADGYLYMVVPLGTLTAGQDKTLTITATLGSKFGDQTAEVFLFGSDEFYNARSGGGSIQNTADFPADIKADLGMTPGVKMVKNMGKITVSGMFAFNSQKTVSVPGGTPIDRGMKASSRNGQVLTYTLSLINESENISYTGLTIIDRLPVKGDKFVLVDETNRGSTTKATVKTAPTVQIGDASGSGWTTVPASQYTVQYVGSDEVGPAYAFTNADFRLPDDGAPSTEANWVNASSWPANKEIAAFRIVLNNPLEKQKAIRVTYTADAPEDDMPKQGAVAVNSFAAGFQAQIGATTHKVKPEPDFAQVTFPDILPMIIEGIVFTEADDKIDGIYQSGVDISFTDFTKGEVKLTLYRADDAQGANRSAVKTLELDPAHGTYKFDELYDPGVYSVELAGIPEKYVIYEEIINHIQGNQFDTDGLAKEIPYEEGKTHRRNADILSPIKGTLTLQKTLSSGNGYVGGKEQKFVFRIDYIPHDSIKDDHPPMTFYEVLAGNETKVVIDLPRGTYTVTEVDGWATGYQQAGGTAYLGDNNKLERATPDITATCTNELENRSFLYAIGEAINKFNEKAPQ